MVRPLPPQEVLKGFRNLMASVTLTDVCKDYPGGIRAVDRVNLAIADAEFVVLVGPSGCGKSTTLRMVAGLEEISGGTVKIGDRVVNDVAPKDRDIAMVFQNYALYPHMSVYENMAFGLKIRRRELGLGRRQIDVKVREAAAALGITDLLPRKPKALSGGQRQRVAVGRAIVRSPQAFLFDEPLSNLDAKLRVEMRSELKRLHRSLRTTTIYVTHDQEEAMTLGDRVVVMLGGTIQQTDSPQTLYDRPANRFVAGFIGTPHMNLVDGRVARRANLLVFEFGKVVMPLPAIWAAAAEPLVGREAALGVRPDAIGFPSLDAPIHVESGTLACRISLVEPLGDRKDLYLQVAEGRPWIARVDSHVAAAEGEQRPISIDFRRCHLFEPGELGRNLTAALTAGLN